MDFVIMYSAVCAIGILFVLGSDEFVGEFDKKWVRIALRFGFLLAWPLMLLALFIAGILEIEL